MHKGKSLSIWVLPKLQVASQLSDPSVCSSLLRRLWNKNLREAYSTFKDTSLWIRETTKKLQHILTEIPAKIAGAVMKLFFSLSSCFQRLRRGSGLLTLLQCSTRKSFTFSSGIKTGTQLVLDMLSDVAKKLEALLMMLADHPRRHRESGSYLISPNGECYFAICCL